MLLLLLKGGKIDVALLIILRNPCVVHYLHFVTILSRSLPLPLSLRVIWYLHFVIAQPLLCTIISSYHSLLTSILDMENEHGVAMVMIGPDSAMNILGLSIVTRVNLYFIFTD